MAEIDVRTIPFQQAYKLLIGAIVPRPIAWVSSVSSAGLTNLAPFSFFTGICSNPPSLLFCPVNHPDGREKDTLRNIRETREFVVNIVSENLATVMNETSAEYAPEISEIEAIKIETLPSKVIKPPRVKASPVQFECELIQIVDVGNGKAGSGHVVIGKLVYAHIVDEAFRDGKILIEAVRPISRLAGFTYAPVREIFELPRPEDPKRT